MNLKPNDLLHGFRVKYSESLPEIRATLWRMEYEKNGADLIWLDRDDDNQTFAIAFKTIPQDHTGVFHILEHSVLCGSEKYPVKEPFVNLLKSSMATFLNAFTFPDKTMYPLSSRNGQDFLNLIDVYMDAVLHPLSIHDPHAFKQEGWHFELDDADGALRCNGVVYNEMKGAYASPDTVLEDAMNRALFPDNCYGYDSGGNPEHITELTYERYLESHARFYHPSNARIILDGKLDLDAVLAKLDSFLCEYERIDPDADIPDQQPVSPEEQTCCYEIGPEEDAAGKAVLAQGWVLGKFDQIEENLAFQVLSETICNSNEAPLTKALLDLELCEDVDLSLIDSMQQQYAIFTVRNTKPENKETIWAAVTETLESLAESGLDHKRLHSVLNNIEFSTREKDFGSYPRGLVFAMNALTTWLYGGDPAQSFSYDAVFQSLREKIDAGWFESFLRRSLLDNPHHARVCMLPSLTLGAEKAQKEAERCRKIKEGWSDAEVQQVLSDFRVLRKRQEAEDTPEQLATLPVLSLSDIPEQGSLIRQNVLETRGVTVLHQPEETDGISYLDLYFDLSDRTEEELSQIAFFSGVLGDIATEHYSAPALRSELEGNLGRFTVSTPTYAKQGSLTEAQPKLILSVALLNEKKADAVRLLEEIIHRTDFTVHGDIFNLLRQARMGMEQRIIGSGNAYGAMRTAASGSVKAAINEHMSGITQLRWLQKTEKAWSGCGAEHCNNFAELCPTLFSKNRLTVSITGELDMPWVEQIIDILSDAPMGRKRQYSAPPVRKEGFVIPAEIGFAARTANLLNLDSRYSGPARVAAQILTYGYLWNDIRVVGGAYGTSLSLRIDGDARLTTYRDPSPARSLLSFDGAGAALREFCASGEPLDGFIISSMAASDPIVTPAQAAIRGGVFYFSGRTNDDRVRERHEILHTTREQLVDFSHTLDAVCKNSGICVIGGRDVLDACTELETVEPLQ